MEKGRKAQTAFEISQQWRESINKLQQKLGKLCDEDISSADLVFISDVHQILEQLQKEHQSIDNQQKIQDIMSVFSRKMEVASEKIVSLSSSLQEQFIAKDIYEMASAMVDVVSIWSAEKIEEEVPVLCSQMQQILNKLEGLEEQKKRFEQKLEKRSVQYRASWRTVQERLQLNSSIGECCCQIIAVWTRELYPESEEFSSEELSDEIPVVPEEMYAAMLRIQKQLEEPSLLSKEELGVIKNELRDWQIAWPSGAQMEDGTTPSGLIEIILLAEQQYNIVEKRARRKEQRDDLLRDISPSSVQGEEETAEKNSESILEYQFPAEILNWSDFCAEHWIDSEGDVQKAPWKNEDVLDKWVEHCAFALDKQYFWMAYCYAAALERIDPSLSPVTTTSIQCLYSICRAHEDKQASPFVSLAGLSEQRLDELQKLETYSIEAQRIIILLEAFFPSSYGDRRSLYELKCLVPFVEQNVEFIIQQLLYLQQNGMGLQSVLEHLHPQRSRKKEVIDDRQELFRLYLSKYKDSSKGKTRREERMVWQEFIKETRSRLSLLYPSEKQEKQSWNTEIVSAEIEYLEQFRRKMLRNSGWDTANKKAASSISRKILELAYEINAHQQTSQQSNRQQNKATVTIQSLRSIQLSTSTPAGANCHYLWEIVCADWKATKQVNVDALEEYYPLTFPLTVIYHHPFVVTTMKLRSVVGEERLSIEHIEDARAFVAHLDPFIKYKSPKTIDEVKLIFIEEQYKALSLYVQQLFSDDLGENINLACDEIQRDRNKSCTELFELSSQLAKYNDPRCQSLADISQEASMDVYSSSQPTYRNFLLMEYWLKQVITASEQLLERWNRYYQDQSNSEAIASLHKSNEHPAYKPVRNSFFRKEAEEMYSKNISEYINASENKAVNALLTEWSEGRPQQYNSSLVKIFCDAICPGLEVQLVKRNWHYWAEMSTFVELLTSLGPSTFLPQLNQYQRLCIAAPQLGEDAWGLAQRIAKEHRKYHEYSGDLCNIIVVLLLPNIDKVERKRLIEVSSAMDANRVNRASIVVLDNLDIFRLVTTPNWADENKYCSLFELFLEQQSLDVCSPFDLPNDGSVMKWEMFVGREKERSGVLQGQYTRVFSGRKLGKSALLMSLQKLYKPDNINIVFITLGDVSSEKKVVAVTLEELRNQLGFAPTIKKSSSPSDTIKQVWAQYAKAYKDRPLLLIYDESDLFVEGQLAEYNKAQEATLSFTLSRSKHIDAQGRSLIRCVFAGYRATDTDAGAWGNWGSKLILMPLEHRDIFRLLHGPLDRLGYDLRTSLSQVAHMCGGLPVVAFKVGAAIIKALKDREMTSAERGLEDFDATFLFYKNEVLSEIYNQINLNFTFNNFSAAVFFEIIQMLKENPMRHSIQYLPKQLSQRFRPYLKKLRKRKTEQWLEQQIASSLLDLCNRKLLKEMRLQSRHWSFDKQEYALYSPHFVPMLTYKVGDDFQKIVEERLMLACHEEDKQHVSSRLLSQSAIDLIEDIWEEDNVEERIRLVLISSWPTCFEMEGGAYLRAKFPFSYIGSSQFKRETDESLQQEYVFYNQLTKAQIDLVLEKRDSTLPVPIFISSFNTVEHFQHKENEGAEWWLEYLGRFTEEHALWWFCYKHSIACEGDWVLSSLAREIISLTSGIPYLVSLLEKIVGKYKNDNISKKSWKDVKGQFNAALPEHIAKLLKHSKFRRSDWQMLLELERLLGDCASDFSPEEVQDLVQEDLLNDAWDDSALIRLRGWGFWPEGEPQKGDRIFDILTIINDSIE